MFEYLVIGAISFIGAIIVYAILDSNGTNRETVNFVSIGVFIVIFYLLLSNPTSKILIKEIVNKINRLF